MSDDSEDEDAEMGGQPRGAETTQGHSENSVDDDENDDDDDAIHSDSIMLTLSGAMVSLDIEIQVKLSLKI